MQAAPSTGDPELCCAKAKNVSEAKQGTLDHADMWAQTAVDAEIKLVPSWLVAARRVEAALAS